MSISKRKEKLKMNQIILDAIKLLKCDTGRIAKLNSYFFIAGYYKIESILVSYDLSENFVPTRYKITHENCVASGKDLDSLWKSIFEYHRLSNMSTLDYIEEIFHVKLDDALVYKELRDGGFLSWQL